MTFTAQQIAAFIQENYPRTRTWSTKALVNWVSWALEQGFCLLAGEEDRLMGVLLVRPTMTPQECINNLLFDPEGDTLFIDMAVIMSPRLQVMRCLAFAILARFGQRDKLAYQHHGRGAPIITDAKRHRRKLLIDKKKVYSR